MIESRPGFIYGIYRADGRLCYIGKTTSTLRRRWSEHLWDLQKGAHRNHYLQRIYRKEDGWLILKPIRFCLGGEIDAMEKAEIAEAKQRGIRLCNLLSGGWLAWRSDGAGSSSERQTERRSLMRSGSRW
jgi:hypothetical protein